MRDNITNGKKYLMLSRDEILTKLYYIPKYDKELCLADASTRILELEKLYNIYLPTSLNIEIYNRLYIAIQDCVENRKSVMINKRRNDIFFGTVPQNNNGTINGRSSFTIIGDAGSGKTTAVQKSISLITTNAKKINVKDDTFIPFLLVQTPADGSAKSLLLGIICQIDKNIGSDYFERALRQRMSTPVLLNMVSVLLINYVGVLILDEIQFLCRSRYTNNLVDTITELVNLSGITICMVGTEDADSIFCQNNYLARRTIGLRFEKYNFDEFIKFVNSIWDCQVLQQKQELTEGILVWLYENTFGIPANIISLFHDAQVNAILSGKEVLDIETLRVTYLKQYRSLYKANKIIYKDNNIRPVKNRKRKGVDIQHDNAVVSTMSIAEYISQNECTNKDIISVLSKFISITEVEI